ncbi:hypothetical protein [Neobacillus sp. NPDC093127]|uniref:hypothetical protein n=1 Tax=Neobacillus sp. NPDC093127 TaxID=3364296 RepID=UPI00382D866F
MNNGKLSGLKSFINNPLGIIGLFLVLVDGIAAFVIIQSKLTYSLNLIIVLFIVLFPVFVLLIFYNLVTKYHKNLYAPSDYKNDETFLKTFDHSLQTTVDIPVNEFYKNMLENERDNNKELVKIVENLEGQLKELVSKVNGIEITDVVGEEKKQEISKMSKKIVNAVDLLKNEQFLISVNAKLRNSKELEGHFQKLGFKTELYDNNIKKEKDAQESIWLGHKVPIETVKSVIIKAHNFYPHIKYIHLSNDNMDKYTPDYIHNQIFIGGATSAAKRFNLTPLSSDDFEKIKTFNNLKELHSFIRSFYQSTI